MLQIILIILGIFAIMKGKIQATPTKTIPAKVAKIMGGIFVGCGLLPLIIPGGVFLMLIIALITAVVGVVLAR